ncbi:MULTISPECIES: 3-oxoacyl-ACP reductase FabG [Streptomyces]|uniref:3-oxoacyl-ACP reductase FabG n=1 Tax=Streptomyces TaxID=1883 RepID=UPI0016713175|nr:MULTISPECIES: 3-oxoacyl-ACP reductase FabG [Streptomyces]UFR03550.1 3-oxoacyl-ACP reductase FabG [Streptomyces sp. Go40/10]GGS57815.1 3-oxoacyl-[acyl-carrier-protein] reductase [Streptomyces cinerochromogenes]
MTQDETRPVALVTGGSRGIGRAVVRRLAEDHRVAFCHTRSGAEAAAQLVKEVGEAGGHAVAHQADVTSRDEVRALVETVQRDLGPIDTLVTSAGIVRDNPLVIMSDEDWQDVIDTNLGGTYHVCRAVVFEMMKRKRGSVINIASVAGVHGHARQTNYSASKAGIIGFSKALAKEVARYGIRVNVIAPGFIETDMTASLNDAARDEALRSVPLGRFGRPEEVADMVGYVTTAGYVTGAVLHVDGGIVI